MKIIDIIAGARPNFMKIAALFAVADKFPFLQLRLIHTGQHYDKLMSDVFFRDLGLPEPICNLGVGSGTHGTQTAKIMMAYEKWAMNNRPNLCLVVGDVNSTIACVMVAKKLGIPVAHVESGLRSFDRTMPEEINRILTDSISDLFFVTEPSGVFNLAREGKSFDAIHLVGNVMIDTLFRMKPKAAGKKFYRTFKLKPRKYALVTLHRPSNVDNIDVLKEIIKQIMWLSDKIPVIFVLHPRTKKNLQTFGLLEGIEQLPSLHLSQPLPYLDSLSLIMNAVVVVTDSGGLQEETSALRIPCLTIRENTERPITINEGTNTLIGNDWKLFRECIDKIKEGNYKKIIAQIPYWDGHAGERILNVLSNMESSGVNVPMSKL